MRFIPSDPSDFIFVPERFPPLRERAGAWTKERLTSELSDGNDDLAKNRDEIPLQELLGRGLSTAEFQQLLAAPGPFRVEHVMQALLSSKRIAQYGPALRDVLLAQNPAVHRSAEIVRVTLRVLQSSADVDVCDVVSRFSLQAVRSHHGALLTWRDGVIRSGITMLWSGRPCQLGLRGVKRIEPAHWRRFGSESWARNRRQRKINAACVPASHFAELIERKDGIRGIGSEDRAKP